MGNEWKTRDLNISVATGKNWAIPSYHTAVLKYITAPIIAIIFSFAYPTFHELRYGPLHIAAFALMHLGMVIVAFGFILPRWFDVFVPASRRGEGKLSYAPNVAMVANVTDELRSAELAQETASGGSDGVVDEHVVHEIKKN